MNSPTRVADFAMLTLSVTLGVGSVVMFVMLPSVHYLPMRWRDSFVLPWDALLSLAFFAQHSGMVRRSARARLAAVIPTRYQGAAYAIASGIVLALVVVLWQRSETRLFVLSGVPRRIAQALSALAVATFVLSALTLRRSFDPLGLGPIRAHLRGQAYRPADVVVRGPYLWVPHPLYSWILVMLWTTLDVTADGLLLSVMWTIWICAGAVLEERDLVAEFGDGYRAYQRQVSMLVQDPARPVEGNDRLDPRIRRRGGAFPAPNTRLSGAAVTPSEGPANGLMTRFNNRCGCRCRMPSVGRSTPCAGIRSSP